MRRSGSSRIGVNTGAPSSAAASPTPHLPMVNCDLCEGAFILPAEIAAQGVIHGLLVCTQCIEDSLFAKQLEAQP